MDNTVSVALVSSLKDISVGCVNLITLLLSVEESSYFTICLNLQSADSVIMVTGITLVYTYLERSLSLP